MAARVPPNPVRGQEPRGRARRGVPAGNGRRWLALAAVVLLGLGYATMIESFSWNQSSHYDLIRSLDRDTTTIDAYQVNTGDKAFYKGHWYSARAPGLALYSLPFYDGLRAANVPQWARTHHPQRNDDATVWAIGLWGNVLPGLLLALLVWRVSERFEPGYGPVAAIAFGMGTIVLPLSTLLFSHVFTAFLGFAAFALMLRERDGPESLSLIALAGLAVGYAITSEYPLALVAAVLGLYLLSRRDTRTPWRALRRALAYAAGGVVGIVPLLIYNHYAFHSWTHLAYSDVPRQHAGFFGIGAPSLRVLATLLFDSRGLLTLSPVLAMGVVGLVLLYRRGRRAEATVIGSICVLFLAYNSGYYLPFGGGFMGPRFLTTMLPFLAVPLALAFRRFPGPTIALAGASAMTMVAATITHPLTGYETETVVWARYLRQGFFQPTIATAYGAGRGWTAVLPFFAAIGSAAALAAYASRRFALTNRSIVAGLAALGGWALFAAVAPTALGIDTAGLKSIFRAGDRTALHKGFGTYPLTALVLIAAIAGLVVLLLARLLRHRPPTEGDAGEVPAAARRTTRGRSLVAAAGGP
jgi:hypothetical protein